MIKCPLCKKQKNTVFYKKLRKSNEFKLNYCSHCGLYYLKPFPNREKIASFYGKNYYYDISLNDGVFAKKAYILFDFIKKYLPSKGKSLDIGCSKGFLAYYFKKNGFDAHGIDLSKNACLFARKLGIKTFVGDLLKYNPNIKFDVITLIDLLEHVDNPLKILKKVHSLLNKNGIVIISTPNIKSFYSIMSGDNWGGFDLPFHITYFSKNSLLYGLTKAGFKSNVILTDNFNLLSIEGLLRANLNVFFGKIFELFGLRKRFREKFMLPNINLKFKEKIPQLDVKLTILDKLKKIINFPLNILFNKLLLGDQVISVSKK